MRTRPPCKLLFIAKGTLRDSGRKHFCSTSQKKNKPTLHSTPHTHLRTRHHNPSSPTVFFFLRSPTSRNVNPLLLARLLLFHHSRNQKKKSVCSLQEGQARPRTLRMQYTKLLLSPTSFLLAFFLAFRGLLPSSCKNPLCFKDSSSWGRWRRRIRRYPISKKSPHEKSSSSFSSSSSCNQLEPIWALQLKTHFQQPSNPSPFIFTKDVYFLQQAGTPIWASSRSFRRTLAASKSLSPSNFKTPFSASKYLLKLPTSKVSSQLPNLI